VRAKVRVGELVVDPKLIELRPINPVFVSRYRQSYRMGAAIPPLIVEEGTNRIISGNHRFTAMVQEFGPDHETEVIYKAFENELEVLKEFTRENAAHGYPLDGITRKRLVAAMLDLGAPIEEVARLLNVPVRNLETWGRNFVAVIGSDGMQRHVPVKRGFPAVQTTITPQLYEEHKRADRGLKVEELVGQLLRWLRNGWVEPREEITASLDELRREIARFLKQARKAA
jgi:DNA-binding transcriptional MerR regulator